MYKKMNSLLFGYVKIGFPTIIKPYITKKLSTQISSSALIKNKTGPQTTVDTAHVERHSKLVEQWWDPNGSMLALHSFNLVRVPFIRDGLVPPTSESRSPLPLLNKSVIDVGCGGGILSEALARLGANVTGIDASKELIELANSHSQLDSKISKNKPIYKCETIEDHTRQCTNQYDAVVASEVLEHVSDKELFLKSCVQTLKPGGKIFITTPNKSRLSQLLGICVSEYVLKSIPKGTHEYEKFTTPNEVSLILERNNCHVQVIHGVMYYPIINKWAWVKSPILLFAMQAVKLENDLSI